MKELASVVGSKACPPKNEECAACIDSNFGLFTGVETSMLLTHFDGAHCDVFSRRFLGKETLVFN